MTRGGDDDVVDLGDELVGDEPYLADLGILDDCSGWTVSLFDPRLGAVVPWRTSASVAAAVDEVRSIVARMLNVDRNSFAVDVLAHIDERHARMIDGLHDIEAAP